MRRTKKRVPKTRDEMLAERAVEILRGSEWQLSVVTEDEPPATEDADGEGK